MTFILIEDAPYFAVAERFGRSHGIAVYKHETVAAVRVAGIGFIGNEGIARARAEIAGAKSPTTVRRAEMYEIAAFVTAKKPFPLSVIEYPNGRFGFVGRVPEGLAYVGSRLASASRMGRAER